MTPKEKKKAFNIKNIPVVDKSLLLTYINREKTMQFHLSTINMTMSQLKIFAHAGIKRQKQLIIVNGKQVQDFPLETQVNGLWPDSSSVAVLEKSSSSKSPVVIKDEVDNTKNFSELSVQPKNQSLLDGEDIAMGTPLNFANKSWSQHGQSYPRSHKSDSTHSSQSQISSHIPHSFTKAPSTVVSTLPHPSVFFLLLP